MKLFIACRSAVLRKAEWEIKQKNHRERYLTRVLVRNGESGSEGTVPAG